MTRNIIGGDIKQKIINSIFFNFLVLITLSIVFIWPEIFNAYPKILSSDITRGFLLFSLQY